MFYLIANALIWVNRPQVYWGTRTMEPNGLLAGLMWFNASHPAIRHVCDNNYPHSYYHLSNDGENYSYEVIKDGLLTLHIEHAQTDGEWVVSIKGEHLDPNPKTNAVGLAFYLGSDDKESNFKAEEHDELFGFSGVHKKQEIGLYFENSIRSMSKYSGFTSEPQQSWTIQSLFEKKAMKEQSLFFEDHLDKKDNIVLMRHIHQSIDIKIIFTLNGYKGAKTLLKDFPSRSQDLKEQFDERFSKSFDVSLSKTKKKNKLFRDEYLELSQIAIASTIGGIGYFEGNSIIDKSPLIEDDYNPYDSQFADYFDNDEVVSPEKNKLGHRKDQENPEYTKEMEILTSTPSRSFFPRGFIWDEGFHLLMIGKFNEHLGLDILESWFNMMNENGWIAREQILGDEARSKVPLEFQTQYTYVGNPPTLIIPLNAILERSQVISEFLASKDTTHFEIDTIEYKQQKELQSIYQRVAQLYPKLIKNYEWFLSSQRGESDSYDRNYNTFVFRWRGRTDTHLFASGMDDYPRVVFHSYRLLQLIQVNYM